MNVIRKYKLEITVFISGAVVMIYEIVGSRILSPYFGNSIYVWTSLIGVILASLSLGYYLGGKNADKHQDFNYLSKIFFYAGIIIFVNNIFQAQMLSTVDKFQIDIRTGSLLASLIIFSPASILFGVVAPYAVKLKISSMDKSGSTIGNLYAISSLGSIVGTFISGFYLFSWFRTREVLTVLSIILLFLSFLLKSKGSKVLKYLVLLLIFTLDVLMTDSIMSLYAKSHFVDTDSAYNRIIVYDGYNKDLNDDVRVLQLGKSSHSAIFLDKEDLVFDYQKYFELALHFNKDVKKVLMLGAGAYTYPKYFAEKYPDINIEVVEIDPELENIAKEHFGFEDRDNIKIHTLGARQFLKKTDETYDVIIVDIFNGSATIPFHITTIEYIELMKKHLEDNGVIVHNIISGLEGDKSKFIKAEVNTYEKLFKNVYIFRPRAKDVDIYNVQNVTLVALKSDVHPALYSEDDDMDRKLATRFLLDIKDDEIILTDDYAPVENLCLEITEQMYQ